MHNAPSVSYPAGRSRFAAVLLLAVWLLGCAAAGLWRLQSQDGRRPALMAVALAAAGVLAAWRWWRTAPGTLQWDGEAWSWSVRAGATGSVEVALDLQRSLLVLWRGAGASHWIWLDRTACAERWDELRRAVYSRARPSALPGAQRPAAKP
jgi:toxin CptA